MNRSEKLARELIDLEVIGVPFTPPTKVDHLTPRLVQLVRNLSIDNDCKWSTRVDIAARVQGAVHGTLSPGDSLERVLPVFFKTVECSFLEDDGETQLITWGRLLSVFMFLLNNAHRYHLINPRDFETEFSIPAAKFLGGVVDDWVSTRGGGWDRLLERVNLSDDTAASILIGFPGVVMNGFP